MSYKVLSIHDTRAAKSLAPWAVLALFASPMTAGAQSFSLKLEPGVPIPLSEPQSDIFNAGGGQSFKALFGLAPFLDLGPSATFLLLPKLDGESEGGVVWALGAGARLKRPHDLTPYAVSPWFDADLLYVRTGDLNRPGFDAAVGISAPIGEARTFWVGPFVRYLQVIEPTKDGFDNRDAKLLTLGLSFEVGAVLTRNPQEERIVTREITKEVVICTDDRDGDELSDKIDRCPDVAGPGDNWGCPRYTKVVVMPDKLELKEKIFFAWNEAKIEEVSYPLLDEVVQALKDNKSFMVRVGGYADSSGNYDHNQTLSEKRATAVLDYLVSHGVPTERLTSVGFGENDPNSTNTTAEGREDNRRVEFTVYFIIVEAGASK